MNSCPGFAALNPQHATSSLLISTRVNSLIAVFIASQPELLRSRELYGEHFKQLCARLYSAEERTEHREGRGWEIFEGGEGGNRIE
ncbi:uncharacterized [Tachysurus ichikawai]